MEEEPGEDDDGTDWLLWLALGIGALGLVTGTAIGIYGWKRPRPDTYNTSGEYYDATREDEPYDRGEDEHVFRWPAPVTPCGSCSGACRGGTASQPLCFPATGLTVSSSLKLYDRRRCPA
ncbi:MAG: hypothetical protein U5Q44_10375 [Dehalococcoidia bacterium]|nr:hypothetical protein [Dehalococcoidia bacterium]